MVSISDVARAAGVSVTTVSHTLSGKRFVSADVQARVRAAMQELRYVPRRAAQNLANGRTRLIALIVPDISNSYFAELARGVEEAAIAAEYNVVLCTTGFDHAREVLYLETVQSRAVDGIVYAAGSPPSNSELASLIGGLPLVLVDEEIPGSTAPAIVSDNAEGGRLAAQHLLDLGHREAVLLTAAGLESAAQRVRGFTEVWEAAGLPAPKVFDGRFSYDGARAVLHEHRDLFGAGAATSVFATNDLMGIAAMQELISAGLRVPEDVAVVGFDDSPAAKYSTPQLTSVQQDVGALGGHAARALISALDTEAPATPRRTVFPVELVVRASSAREAARP